MIIGGSKPDTAEVVGRSDCKLPSVNISINEQPSLIVNNDKKILLCGGTNNLKKCLKLDDEGWVDHSDLIEERSWASSITVSRGSFIFGGFESPKTWEWLPTGSNSWKKGGSIPDPGFWKGCVVQVTDWQVILIGGKVTKDKIIQFDIRKGKFEEVGKLNQGRWGHSCIMVRNTIIVSGGEETYEHLTSTELIEVDHFTSRFGPKMQMARVRHGLINTHFNNKPTVFAIGGEGYQNGEWHIWDSIEEWDPDKEQWILLNLTHIEARHSFGYISLPTNLVCP